MKVLAIMGSPRLGYGNMIMQELEYHLLPSHNLQVHTYRVMIVDYKLELRDFLDLFFVHHFPEESDENKSAFSGEYIL